MATEAITQEQENTTRPQKHAHHGRGGGLATEVVTQEQENKTRGKRRGHGRGEQFHVFPNGTAAANNFTLFPNGTAAANNFTLFPHDPFDSVDDQMLKKNFIKRKFLGCQRDAGKIFILQLSKIEISSWKCSEIPFNSSEKFEFPKYVKLFSKP